MSGEVFDEKIDNKIRCVLKENDITTMDALKILLNGFSILCRKNQLISSGKSEEFFKSLDFVEASFFQNALAIHRGVQEKVLGDIELKELSRLEETLKDSPQEE